MQVYLSICLPTYNRKNNLRDAIEALIAIPYFKSGEIEIVVSDNASNDGTQEMMLQYVAARSNIKYYRNETNEGVNVNIYKALILGTGIYRKLCNDTYSFKDGVLEKMVECIKQHASERPLMLFTNSHIQNMIDDKKIIDNLNEFTDIVSYNLTNNTIIGFWDTELSYIPIQDTNVWFYTVQAIFKIIKAKSKVIIYNFKLYDVAVPKNKDLTYGLIPVFYTAYLKCFEPYIGKDINFYTFQQEKMKLLYTFFLQWFCWKETSTNFRFNAEDTVQNLRKAFGSHLVWFTIRLKLMILITKTRSLLKSIKNKYSTENF